MKALLALIALGSVTGISADYYQSNGYGPSSCPSCNAGGGNYQENNSNYHPQGGNPYQGSSNSYQNQQSYSQPSQQNYQQQAGRQYGSPQTNKDQYYPKPTTPQNAGRPQNAETYDYEKPSDKGLRDQKVDNEPKGNPDQELSKKVHDALTGGWFSKGFQEVSYDVNNGNVTLRGTVDTLESKDQAENTIKKLDGVKHVDNQINIVKAEPTASKAYTEAQLQESEKKYPRDSAANSQDRQINAKIRDKLSNGWFSKGNETLIIRTANGLVIISGTVEKPEDSQKVTEQLKDIEGVNSINNQLQVKKPVNK